MLRSDKHYIHIEATLCWKQGNVFGEGVQEVSAVFITVEYMTEYMFLSIWLFMILLCMPFCMSE